MSSSGLLGEGSRGDIPGHITEIWLQAGLPSAAHDLPLLGTGGKDGQGPAFGWGGSFPPPVLNVWCLVVFFVFDELFLAAKCPTVQRSSKFRLLGRGCMWG